MPNTITCADCGAVVVVRRVDYVRCASCSRERKRRRNRDRIAKIRKADPAKLNEATRVWREANRVKSRAASKSWAERNQDRCSDNRRKWRAANPDRKREYDRRDFQKHKAARLASAAVWIVKNPEAYRESRRARNSRRRALLASAAGDWSPGQFVELCERASGRCAYCGDCPQRLTADHVIPLSRGGSNDISNIVPACASCNSSKGARTADEFSRHKERHI